ncbi:Nup133 N terminal like-domain-containing protein [Lipomyces arxii]|uniref:Nup133 N terminal like-domain-containing protein n=1 Tax=Lipomyces arxii TaxID=56418 RepID=UPI0034CF0F56
MSLSASMYPSLASLPGSRVNGSPATPVSMSGPAQGSAQAGAFALSPNTQITPGSGYSVRNRTQQQLYQTPIRGQQFQQQQVGQQSQPLKTPETRLTATSPTGQLGQSDAQDQAPVASLSPIEHAKRVVNSFLDFDSRYPDLDRIVQQTQSSEYQYSPTNEFGPWTPFEQTKTLRIPDVIFEQYNTTECFTKMGLFTQIQRAWIVVDNRLYFWNYLNGQDFLSFEDLSENILSVQLIKPRANVFTDSINYLLLISTASDFHMLGVSFKDNDLQLYDTGLVVSVKGLAVNIVTGSDKTGRIFFGGQGSTDLWEITYSDREGWFRGKCGKVCHTKSGLSGFTPSFSSLAPIGKLIPFSSQNSIIGSILPSNAEESIIAIVVDDSRSLVYTLSSKSTLRAFHMKSPTDLTLMLTYTYTSLCSHLQMINAASPLLDPRSTTIVSIYPVRPSESSQIHIIATTSSGCRLYLRAARSYGFGFSNNENAPPTTMQVIQVRFPPGESTARLPATTTDLSPTKVSRIYAPGYFMAVKAGDIADKLFMSAPDTGRILSQLTTLNTVPQLVESGMWASIGGYVQEIALVTPEFQIVNKPEGFGNEVCGQYSVPPTEVAVLTNEGVYMFKRRYMVDTFKDLGNDTRVFLETYGRAETCCTALAIASSPSYSLEAREAARRAYIEYGGKAHLRDENYGSVALSFENVRLSGRFDGLATYISRIVRAIWRIPILKVTASGPNGRKSYASSIALGQLTKYSSTLIEVFSFLEQNRNYIDGLSGPDRVIGGLEARNEDISQQAEHRGMNALMHLARFMEEALLFIATMTQDSKRLNECMTNLQPESIVRISKLTFQDLFTTPEGTELAKELVSAMVNQYIASGSSVDSIVDVLRKQSSIFCSADDILLFHSMELLHRAKSVALTDPDLKNQILRDSIRLLNMAKNVSFEDLRGAVLELNELCFHPGAVEVTLKAAIESDRGIVAISYYIDGMPPNDPRADLYNKRLQCYNLVFTTLSDIDERARKESESTQQILPTTVLPMKNIQDAAYKTAFASRDQLFHYLLYDWYVERGLAERLLDLDLPFIEPYLEKNATVSLEQANWLWVYYGKKEEFLKAARVLSGLARKNFAMPLENRIEYLSRARSACQCACPPSQRQEMLQILQQTQDEYTVACIQLDLLTKIKEDVRFADDEGQRARLVKKLDDELLDLSRLYNGFAYELGYKDICEEIVKAADYRG